MRNTADIIPSEQDSYVYSAQLGSHSSRFSISCLHIAGLCRYTITIITEFGIHGVLGAVKVSCYPEIGHFLIHSHSLIFVCQDHQCFFSFCFFLDMKGFLIATATQEERWFDHVVTGFYVFIFVIAIITNTFLFMVFLKNKSFRDLSTYLIVQMAAADVIYLCLTCSIIVIKNLEIQISRPVCKSLLYVEGAARFASSLSLMLISLERSMSVCSPTLCYSIRKISGVKKKVSLSQFRFTFCLIPSPRLRKYFKTILVLFAKSGRRGGVMVCALVTGLSGPRSSPGRNTVLCSWARHFTLTVPLSSQVYK